MMKLRLHFPGFFTTIFRVFAIEENQEALSNSGQESNSPHKDNNDEERPAGFNILPTDPAFRQPDGIYERYAMIGAAGLSVLELDHESLTIVPKKLRTSQNSQCNESSCSEQWELISDSGHSDSESSSGEEWELIPDDGRSNSESTSSEHWELIPDDGRNDSESTSGEEWELIPDGGRSDSESTSGEEWELFPDDGRSNSESTSGEHWELIPDDGRSNSESSSGEQLELIPDDGRNNSESTGGEQLELIPDDGRNNSESTGGEHRELIPDHGHSDSECRSGESWESLSDYHSASDDSVCDDSVCVENNCGDPWQKLQEPLQGTGTQPKQGAVSRFLLLVNENILSTLLGVIWYLCSYLFLLSKGILSLVTGKGINPGSCVHCGAVARSLHHNVGQNTNCGGDQTIGGVNHEEGHSRLVVNGAGDIVISHLYINTSASHGANADAGGLKVLLFDHESQRILPNKFRTTQVINNSQCDESSSYALSISGYDHSRSESSDEEILTDCGNNSDSNYTCVESISRFLLLLYKNLILSSFLWIRGILRFPKKCHYKLLYNRL